jgi:hypothetical protein
MECGKQECIHKQRILLHSVTHPCYTVLLKKDSVENWLLSGVSFFVTRRGAGQLRCMILYSKSVIKHWMNVTSQWQQINRSKISLMELIDLTGSWQQL